AERLYGFVFACAARLGWDRGSGCGRRSRRLLSIVTKGPARPSPWFHAYGNYRMMSVEKAVGTLRSLARKTADKSRSLATKAVETSGHLFLMARTSRFVRKFSWKRVFKYVGVGLLLSLFGIVVGGMAVLLPPIASLATMAIPALLLIWASPELRRVPTKLMSRAFYAYVFILA